MSPRGFGTVLAVALLGASVTSQAGPTPDTTGDAIFLAQGCDACHAVPTAGIAKRGDPTVAGPDLQALAEEHKPRSLERWLKRERGHDGYTHLQYFQGSSDELDLLVAWLLAQ